MRDPRWSRVAPRFPTTRGAFRRPRASATTIGSTATSARSRSASASATRVFGSLRAREGITVGADTTIHGDVTTRGGTVTVEAGARVLGDVSAGDLVVHDGAGSTAPSALAAR